MTRPIALAVLAMVVAGACGSGDDVDWESRPGRRDPDPPPSTPLDPPPPSSPPSEPEPDPEPARAVVVNGLTLDDVTLTALEQELGWAIADGAYWYDPVLGAVGVDGGPTAGFLPPGLGIGGALPEDASWGDTGVVVNGRELPVEDLLALEQLFLGPVPPDRYYLDADGWYGYEGDAPLGNVFDLVAQQQSTGGGGGGPVTETAGGWLGGSADDSYYFDPSTGCSVMSTGVSC